MKKQLAWGGWRNRELRLGDVIVANVMVLWCGCVFVNERGWGRGRLRRTYGTVDEAKRAAEIWACRRAVRQGVRDAASANA